MSAADLEQQRLGFGPGSQENIASLQQDQPQPQQDQQPPPSAPQRQQQEQPTISSKSEPEAGFSDEEVENDSSIYQQAGNNNTSPTSTTSAVPLLNSTATNMPETTHSSPCSSEGSNDDSDQGKIFACPHCSQVYTRNHNLKSHLLTHTSEKPYTCDLCSSKFRRLHDLKRHAKLHTGERPYECDKCGRRFARADALIRHCKSGPCNHIDSEPSKKIHVMDVKSRPVPFPLKDATDMSVVRPLLIGPPFVPLRYMMPPPPGAPGPHANGGTSTPPSAIPPPPPHSLGPSTANIANNQSGQPSYNEWNVVHFLEARIRMLEDRLYNAESRIAYLEEKSRSG